jgi:hydroxymethylglutaryl-CoA lyase
MSAAMNSLHWHEVAPRDGLQNEATLLTLQQKLELMKHLVAAQPASIEVTSFVRPDRVPQLADAAELCQALADQTWAQEARANGMRLTGLVANQRGLDRLLEAGLDSVTVLVSATEAHSQSNVGMSRGQAAELAQQLISQAKAHNVFVRAYVSMAYVCPFDGVVASEPVLELLQQFHQWGADLILPADTLGAAEPQAVRSLLEQAKALLPTAALGLHMHNTHGRALENCQIGWQLGIRHFDAAAAGTGGCPFAPGAAGNLSSSSLLKWAAAAGADVPWPNAPLDAAESLLRELL